MHLPVSGRCDIEVAESKTAGDAGCFFVQYIATEGSLMGSSQRRGAAVQQQRCRELHSGRIVPICCADVLLVKILIDVQRCSLI